MASTSVAIHVLLYPGKGIKGDFQSASNGNICIPPHQTIFFTEVDSHSPLLSVYTALSNGSWISSSSHVILPLTLHSKKKTFILLPTCFLYKITHYKRHRETKRNIISITKITVYTAFPESISIHSIPFFSPLLLFFLFFPPSLLCILQRKHVPFFPHLLPKIHVMFVNVLFFGATLKINFPHCSLFS